MDNETKQQNVSNPIKHVVMWIICLVWKMLKLLVPALIVIFAIGFAIEWGGLFYREYEHVKGIISWLVIWCAIDFYSWAKQKRLNT